MNRTKNNYWFIISSVWSHYFTKIIYKNGDVVWISKLTGKGYAGITYNNLTWDKYTENPS